jgi:hypothetical protein
MNIFMLVVQICTASGNCEWRYVELFHDAARCAMTGGAYIDAAVDYSMWPPQLPNPHRMVDFSCERITIPHAG